MGAHRTVWAGADSGAWLGLARAGGGSGERQSPPSSPLPSRSLEGGQEGNKAQRRLALEEEEGPRALTPRLSSRSGCPAAAGPRPASTLSGVHPERWRRARRERPRP